MIVAVVNTRAEVQDGLTVVIGKDSERVAQGRFGIGHICIAGIGRLSGGDNGLSDLLRHPDAETVEKTVEALFGRCGAGQHCDLVRSELFAECGEPALLKVLLADDY